MLKLSKKVMCALSVWVAAATFTAHAESVDAQLVEGELVATEQVMLNGELTKVKTYRFASKWVKNCEWHGEEVVKLYHNGYFTDELKAVVCADSKGKDYCVAKTSIIVRDIDMNLIHMHRWRRAAPHQDAVKGVALQKRNPTIKRRFDDINQVWRKTDCGYR